MKSSVFPDGFEQVRDLFPNQRLEVGPAAASQLDPSPNNLRIEDTDRRTEQRAPSSSPHQSHPQAMSQPNRQTMSQLNRKTMNRKTTSQRSPPSNSTKLSFIKIAFTRSESRKPPAPSTPMRKNSRSRWKSHPAHPRNFLFPLL